jgi:hypothetical protein
LSWVGDKIVNAGDYIENGLIRLVGFIPGGDLTTEEMLENKRLAEESGNQPYYDVRGNLQTNPIKLTAPVLPIMPANATPAMKALYADMKRARFNWQVRESQLRKVGKADMIESTGTAKVYRHLEKAWDDLVNKRKLSTKNSNEKLNKKQIAEFKANKYMASEADDTVGDLRTLNSGRPALKGRQWDEVERVLRTDSNPKAKALLN